jgi:hypothetical protein
MKGRLLYGVDHNDMVELVSELNGKCHDAGIPTTNPFVYACDGLVWCISYKGKDIANPKMGSMSDVKRVCQSVMLKESLKKKR